MKVPQVILYESLADRYNMEELLDFWTWDTETRAMVLWLSWDKQGILGELAIQVTAEGLH